MTRGQRWLTYAAAAFAVVVLGWAAIFATVYVLGGVGTVSVVSHEDDFRFKAPIPMALVHAAATTARSTQVFSLDDLEVELQGEFGDLGEWGGMVVEMLEALDDVPNGTTFVSVQDGDDRVRVSKERGKFRVEVDNPDISVRVAVPTRSVVRTVSALVD